MNITLTKKGHIKYNSQEKTIIYPNDYNSFLEQLSSNFNISSQNQIKSLLIIINKSLFKIETSEQYSNFLKDLPNDEIAQIIIFFNDNDTNIINFPSFCHICEVFPIQNIMFYCQKCDTNFCEECEKNIGYNHRHCYYKIKNMDQYEEVLNIKIKGWNNNKINKSKKKL